MSLHPITAASFQIIDTQLGILKQDNPDWQAISYTPQAYEVVRRAIHSTADFELYHLCRFSPDAITTGIRALRQQVPVIVDVRMVKVGVQTALDQAGIPLYCAIEAAESLLHLDPTQTRTAQGMRQQLQRHPEAMVVVGNAPTALETVVQMIHSGEADPCLVIGVPVGFVGVLAAKAALQSTAVPQIRVEGYKGGSPVAAGMVNALVELSRRKEH